MWGMSYGVAGSSAPTIEQSAAGSSAPIIEQSAAGSSAPIIEQPAGMREGEKAAMPDGVLDDRVDGSAGMTPDVSTHFASAIHGVRCYICMIVSDSPSLRLNVTT